MDDFSREELEQLYGVFRDQTMHILEDMSEDLLALESGSADREVMKRLRRAAHTIKGDSACIGLDGVTEAAHCIEDLFSQVSEGEGRIRKETIDSLFEFLDAIREAVCGDEINDISGESVEELLRSLKRTVAEGEVTISDEQASGDGSRIDRIESRREAEKSGEQPRRRYIRIEASKVDSLLNLAGEMVIARSVMNQVGPELEQVLGRSALVGRFNSASAQMGKLISELQKSVLKMRVVTIDNLFKRFARPMRELAHESGKKIEVEVKGGDTELDRALVELLYEPLLHLLRNAVDHGLEFPQERLAMGKTETGRIRMSAYHEGNQVVVEVGDDGRGIDVEALKVRGIESGAITKAEADRMTDEEALDLIFVQGLSTAREVTKVSGRGVGASAIKTVVEQLRGSISIESRQGEGTRFILRMPLTLAMIRALLFFSEGRLFALPLLSVSEIVKTREEDVRHLDGFESYRLRDRFVSLVRPGAVLGFERKARRAFRGADSFYLIVLSAGDKRYGVVADSLIGEQEIVIKPLEGDWVQSDVLAGASVLGDGSVALIMDAGRLFRRSVRYERGLANRKAYGN